MNVRIILVQLFLIVFSLYLSLAGSMHIWACNGMKYLDKQNAPVDAKRFKIIFNGMPFHKYKGAKHELYTLSFKNDPI